MLTLCYSFPKNVFIKKAWLKFCLKEEVTKSSRMCALHFDDNCFINTLSKRLTLKPMQIPSIKEVQQPLRPIEHFQTTSSG